MTDEQLIEQLEQGSPEDFSREQLELIRSRLAVSPALAAALGQRLRVEQCLAGALGAQSVTKEQVVARAAGLRQMGGGGVSKRAIVGWVAGFGLASVALFFAVRPFLPRRVPSASADVSARAGVAAKAEPAESLREGAAVAPGREGAAEGPSEKTPVSSPRVKPEAQDVAEEGPARPLSDVIFEDIGGMGSAPRESDLRRWFTTAEGHAHRFTERMVQNRRCGFDGWVRLRGAWPKDGLLRLALVDYDRLRLHFYRGEAGVTLEYFEGQRHAWAAYGVTRKAGEARPQEPVLVSTDEDRSYRTSPSGAGPVDIVWREGELVVSRGDVRLLAAPLAGPPTDVFLEGHAGFRGLALVRTVMDEPAKQPVTPEHPITMDVVPAKEEWTSETPSGSSFTKHDDGSVELAAEKTKFPAWAAWKLPRRELCEVLVQLDHATAGTGVYVADEQGRPVDVVRFFRDPLSERNIVGLASAGDGRSDADINPANGPIPFVSQRPWVKLVVGCGILRTWIGPDGVHWAPAVTTVQNVPAGLATIGPFCKASESKRTIRVARVVVRELDGLTNLVGDEVRGRAKAFVRANNLAEWLKQVSASRPPDLKLDEWARGCALATLGQGADPRLRTALLTMLLDDVASLEAAGLPVETRLKALDDGALVANTWENHADALLFSARYRRLGERLFEAGGTGGASGTPGAGGASGTPDGRASGVPGVLKAATGTPRPYSLLRAAQIRSPVASRHGVPAGVSSLARLELLAAVYDGRWDELDRVCRKVKFWRSFSPGAEGRDNLTDWAQAVAAERLGQRSRSRSAAMLPAWRHPLDEQTAADVFNLMAEFNAALESKAYQDAAGTIASATGKLLDGDSAGLLADAHDRDLFLSLATAVRLSMRDHPPLAEAMNEHFGPIARQRVQRAMSEGDRGVLEAATIQFYGTEAASMAHVWLGSAALALGEFAQALAHFEHARPHAAVGERAAIAARARLAAAYLGREIGPPATTNVTLGPTELSAGEFEALVGEVRGRVDGRGRETHAQQAETRAQQGARLGRAVLEPASYRLEKRGEFDAGTVDRPPGATTDDARAVIDWFARQTAGVLAEERIIFTSRYATTAFDRRSGSEKWRNGPSTPVGRGGGSTSVVAAAHPLIVGNRIFVRRGGTPTLMSIDRENGKTVWEARLERQEAVVSDPLWAGGQLLAFVVRQDERQTVTTLSLAVFDPAVGEVRRRRPLARLRGSWSSQPVCQVTVEDETIYAALGGAVLCCNSAGQIGWLRRSERVPAEVDSWSQLQAHDPPVVIGERLVVTQPGVRVIECLETATGRRHWHRVFPDLVSMVGVAEEFIVVHTRDEVVGLKLGTGEMAWRYRIDGSCTPAGCSKEGKVLLSRTEGRRLTLVWLDAKAGREIGRFAPEGQDAGGMILGPIVAEADGRGWALMSRDEKSARRDLCELISVGPVSAGSKTIEQSVWSGGVRPN